MTVHLTPLPQDRQLVRSWVEIVLVSAYSIAVRRVSCEGLREAKQ